VSFLEDEPGAVQDFLEKPDGDGGWINGGFFVLEPGVFDLIEGDQSSWEGAPMIQLAQDRQLSAYKHHGFWRAMDTLRDKQLLDGLWESSQAPWKIWA
jgi:glucose-1-phosphate cytidylyltransferase